MPVEASHSISVRKVWSVPTSSKVGGDGRREGRLAGHAVEEGGHGAAGHHLAGPEGAVGEAAGDLLGGQPLDLGAEAVGGAHVAERRGRRGVEGRLACEAVEEGGHRLAGHRGHRPEGAVGEAAGDVGRHHEGDVDEERMVGRHVGEQRAGEDLHLLDRPAPTGTTPTQLAGAPSTDPNVPVIPACTEQDGVGVRGRLHGEVEADRAAEVVWPVTCTWS